MFSLLKKSMNTLKYWLALCVFMTFFVWWISSADLMSDVFDPAYERETIIRISKDRDPAWKWMFNWGTQVDLSNIGKDWEKVVSQEPSLIVKLTRYFLTFTIAISVTMILYNGFTYIIQTGRWKEWKNLVSNVVYIVIWILIALFSVIIITLLQSVWTTINNEIALNQGNNTKTIIQNIS